MNVLTPPHKDVLAILDFFGFDPSKIRSFKLIIEVGAVVVIEVEEYLFEGQFKPKDPSFIKKRYNLIPK